MAMPIGLLSSLGRQSQQLRRFDIQGGRQSVDDLEARKKHTVLNLAQITPTDLSLKCEVILRLLARRRRRRLAANTSRRSMRAWPPVQNVHLDIHKNRPLRFHTQNVGEIIGAPLVGISALVASVAYAFRCIS
jgi:hypothetical protein